MKKIHFYKMHGAGNDFILLDNTAGTFEGTESDLFYKMCLPHTGIGADGVMLLEKSSRTDFKLRYFNADGLTAEMCGNGARCAVYLANSLVMAPQKCSFEIDDEIYSAEIINENEVRLQMHTPEMLLSKDEAKFLLEDNFKQAMWIKAAVPHFVLESNSPLDELDVLQWGKYYRHHDKFKPTGTNVNFVTPLESNTIKARVYERGVENETLACGSGAIACAVFANQIYGWDSPISIHFPGGILQVEFEPEYRRIFLTGPVKMVFEGDFEPSYFNASD
jgi:diaminopimelate epimerase